MGKKSYLGGHTVIGPASGWFTRKRSLEELAEDRASRTAEDWRARVSEVRSQHEESLTELMAKKDDAERLQKGRKDRVAAKRMAREERKLHAAELRPSEKVLGRLERGHPNLVNDIKKLFRDD